MPGPVYSNGELQYLAWVKDFATREIIGYVIGSRMTTDLVQRALRKALRYRKPPPGCIHHSGRGIQYCAAEYRRDVEKAGMIASMSQKGNCYDNAPTESYWGHLKQELIYHRHFQSRDEAIAAIREYIEIFHTTECVFIRPKATRLRPCSPKQSTHKGGSLKLAVSTIDSTRHDEGRASPTLPDSIEHGRYHSLCLLQNPSG